MDATPRPPATVPDYVAEGIERQGPETLDDIAEFASELAAHKRRPDPEDIDDEVDEDAEFERRGEDGGLVYRKKVTCGKDNCHCASGGERHGPYLYRYFYDESGSLTSEYLGKPD